MSSLAPLLYCVALASACTALCVGGVLALQLAPSRGRFTRVHWTEHARTTRPGRNTLLFALYTLPVTLGVLSGEMLGITSGVLGWAIGTIVTACSALIIMAWESYWSEVLEGERKPLAVVIRDHSALVVLLLPHMFLVLAVLPFAAPTFGLETALGCVVATFLALFIGWGGLIYVGRFLGLVTPADRRLQAIAEQVARETDTRIRAVWCVRWSRANAFVFPLGRHLLVTRAALDVLADDELAAVCAHEFGHLNESRMARLLQPIGIAILLANVPLGIPLMATWGPTAVLTLVTGTLVLLLLLRRLSHELEDLADASAHERPVEGGKASYARALEKLHRFNGTPAVARASAHGSLYDRMRAAGVEPDFERPAPPDRDVLGGFAITVAVLVYMASLWVPRALPEWRDAAPLVGGPVRALDDFRAPLGRNDVEHAAPSGG